MIIKTKAVDLAYPSQSKIYSIIDEFYRIIRTRYEDILILETILMKTKQIPNKIFEILNPYKLSVQEIERRETLRKTQEKDLLLSVYNIRLKKCDKAYTQLQKNIHKMLQYFSKPSLYLKLEKIPRLAHIWQIMNQICIVPIQKDAINGAWMENDEFLIKAHSACKFLEKYIAKSENIDLYKILYYLANEIRFKIDEYLYSFYGFLNDFEQNQSQILEILVKNNTEIFNQINKYAEKYKKKHDLKSQEILQDKNNQNSIQKTHDLSEKVTENLPEKIKENLSEKVRENLPGKTEENFSSIPENSNKTEDLLKKLQVELQNVPTVAHMDTKISLSEIIKNENSLSETSAKAPSQNLLDSYIQKKKLIQNYINQLEEDFRNVEGIKHIRRCLLLYCIIRIQRIFRKYRQIKRTKNAIKIQRKIRKFLKFVKYKKNLFTKLKNIIWTYKRNRALKLLRKKRLLKKLFFKEMPIVLTRITDLKIYENIKPVIKCQSLIRRFLIRLKICYYKLRKKVYEKRKNVKDFKEFTQKNQIMQRYNNEILMLKICTQKEISNGEIYIQKQRENFDNTWQNYVQDLEKESMKTNATHMKDWVCQRDKYGKSYWLNVKTMAQQNVHPGKSWLNKTKEQKYNESIQKFEKSMLPLLSKLSEYKQKCSQTVDFLFSKQLIELSNLNNK